ncbi:coatomer beta' subunit (COPB2), WD40 repeat, conserved site [Artemisia annua]|uniref:Coatomer beta' subunit (COPB2), WD40 repeat, conserved site n=1 Tax=Artemisia annua TaxID=35608 RepID=A0A2U1P3E3_ARTAN|nr:coatomer beta' subunit (COPB2), WD40 repeat, conserved site [Artemisia annua]
MSVTSLLYLKVEVSIAIAGAAYSVIKCWNMRNLRASIIQARSQKNPDDKRLSTVQQTNPDFGHAQLFVEFLRSAR